jgi:hypothetical protein
VNDYSNFGFNNMMQPEVMTATAKASKKLGIALFAVTAAGVAYVASRPRVQRAWKELMTPEPQNAVNVTAEDYKDARDNAGPSNS